MKGEQQRDHKTAAGSSRRPGQKQEKHSGIQSVQQDAGHVMAGRVKAVELTIDCVGHPGEGMPVSGIEGGQGPAKRGASQSLLDLGIFGHIGLIVEIHKGISRRADVYDAGGSDGQSA